MDDTQWAKLDALATKLKTGYEGHLKGTPAMIKSSMRIAYHKGVTDTIQTIINEQMDMKVPGAAAPNPVVNSDGT